MDCRVTSGCVIGLGLRMQLGQIIIFPIKSLDGVPVETARITGGGILEHDRSYAIYDADGKVVNGKRTPRVHELRCQFDARIAEVRLWPNGESSSAQFQLDDPVCIGQWLSDFFGFAVALRHEPHSGFPDDRTAFGPTITSEASLRTIQGWFPQMTLESVRRRFRTNLELTGGEPFGEDHLFGAPDELKPFQVGLVKFFGHNPCQRCVVPTRDPDSGQATGDFQKKFMELRKRLLPEWANAQRFNHFYRFTVNTSIPPTEAGKQLSLGDPLVF
ncbi:MAG TPA: MOSC N-terminal beta barrel domain-containing protein [Verrucomicrobiae bacterium]|nr:MOSC N-terminal beta barrel domain-containing protein [Verrucomicrobiae bacterium]